MRRNIYLSSQDCRCFQIHSPVVASLRSKIYVIGSIFGSFKGRKDLFYTSLSVGVCLASFTLAKLPLPIVFKSL